MPDTRLISIGNLKIAITPILQMILSEWLKIVQFLFLKSERPVLVTVRGE